MTDRDDRERAIEALSEAYPKTFFVEPRKRRPLKNGIEKDVADDLAADVDDSELRFYDIPDAIEWYRSHLGYQKACSTVGNSRVDLKVRSSPR
jgi:sRNA-binding protein